MDSAGSYRSCIGDDSRPFLLGFPSAVLRRFFAIVRVWATSHPFSFSYRSRFIGFCHPSGPPALAGFSDRWCIDEHSPLGLVGIVSATIDRFASSILYRRRYIGRSYGFYIGEDSPAFPIVHASATIPRVLLSFLYRPRLHSTSPMKTSR